MYPNLRAEIARNNLTLEDIVKGFRKRGIKMTVSSLSLRLSKKMEFRVNEAKALKEILGTTVSLEELFKTSKEVV